MKTKITAVSAASLALVISLLLLVSSPAVSQDAPGELVNLHGWPCPPGYEPRGTLVCETIRSFSSDAERKHVQAQARQSAKRWQAALAEERRRAEDAKREEARQRVELERARLRERDAEAERQAADERRKYAVRRQQDAESRRRRAESAAEAKRLSAEAEQRAARSAAAINKQAVEEERRAIEVEERAAEAERRAASAERQRRVAEAERRAITAENNRRAADAERRRTAIYNHARNPDAYSPEIERAFAARGAAGLALMNCADRLDINTDKLAELDRAAGIGGNERPTVDVTRRVTKAAMERMADAALKHDMSRAEMEQKYGQCALLLYTYGPNGTWIRGLISERRP